MKLSDTREVMELKSLFTFHNVSTFMGLLAGLVFVWWASLNMNTFQSTGIIGTIVLLLTAIWYELVSQRGEKEESFSKEELRALYGLDATQSRNRNIRGKGK
jgi:hypothetical protein